MVQVASRDVFFGEPFVHHLQPFPRKIFAARVLRWFVEPRFVFNGMIDNALRDNFLCRVNRQSAEGLEIDKIVVLRKGVRRDVRAERQYES